MEPAALSRSSGGTNQPVESITSATHENDVTQTSLSKVEIPLPSDVKRILKEVARTGASSCLAWDGGTKELTSGTTGGWPKSMLDFASSTTVASTRQAFSTYRRTAPSTLSGSLAKAPPRKKNRNSCPKSTRRRFTATDTSSRAGTSRKRPLLRIGSHSSTAAATGTSGLVPAPESAGSGRTSGSEPDDSTQYECDSEGTSTTTNSEVSVERLRKTQQRWTAGTLGASKRSYGKIAHGDDHPTALPQHKTLKEVVRHAVGIVLDHFYLHRGGYKLSPAEKRRNKTLSTNDMDKQTQSQYASTSQQLSPKQVFLQRRQRLVEMLLSKPPNGDNAFGDQYHADGPPFTIQRIAEVLVAPDRYYTQTHKLCNCLEKLLLVTSSTTAFGGSTGGATSQCKREEQEMAALANEKVRQETELRLRRMRRRPTSPGDDTNFESSADFPGRSNGQHSKDDATTVGFDSASTNQVMYKFDEGDSCTSLGHSRQASNGDVTSRELLEAAARASLRTKFDHVGIDPHSPDRDVRSIVESRGMTNSPPPPSLALSVAPSNVSLPNHGGVAGFVRQHVSGPTTDHHSLSRIRSPALFPPSDDAAIRASTNLQSATNIQMLQLHHAVALAGVTLGRGPPPSLELMAIDYEAGMPVRPHGGVTEGGDLDVEHGRSSASNSDVDSESDDISLDDSASDRSDGSDSGSAVHYEPFTAARAMALNRMQQQQRLQSRVLTSLTSLHQSEAFRPPADSEYQSGDSIDSMRAEDSGGSDSSSQSSDMAD